MAAATAAIRRRTRSNERVEDLQAIVEHARDRVRVRSLVGRGARARGRARDPGILKLVLYEPPFIVDDSRPPLPDDYVAHLKALAATDRRGEAVEYFMTTARRRAAEAIASVRESPFWPSLEAMRTLWYDGAIMGDGMVGKPLSADRWSSVRSRRW